MKKGFTLIELLVVVLIIGILSAVALPQYQKTVLKSRVAEAWSNISTLNKAAEVYCLENPDSVEVHYGAPGCGAATSLKEALSVSVDNTEYFTYTAQIKCSANKKYFVANYSKGGKSFSLAVNAAGIRTCTGNNCKDLGFVKSGGVSCVNGAGSGGSFCYYMD